jgi:hypothetical protein
MIEGQDSDFAVCGDISPVELRAQNILRQNNGGTIA